MPQIPTPEYDYDVKRLVKAYQDAIDRILQQLYRMDLSEFSRANQLAVLKSIGEIITELNEEAGLFAKESLEKAAKDGVVSAIVSLGVVETVAEAEAIVTFNRVNKTLVQAAIADTQADLLAVTQNVDKKVRSTVRKVSAEVMRNNLTQGINATATLRRDIVKELRTQLGESVNTGIIDAAGRRWKPTTYVDMLVRTKMMEAHKEATINEALGRDVHYGVISRHGAKDACRNWEGKVVKLTRDAEGDYPYVGDLPRKEIFHPFCKHLISPIRRPDRI
ncbi:phage minor capsid protein [Cytobacillus oceanisediminis]|uniref:Minor capsid protein n=1 Tax=Cytobacillus oceanisediminis 2691 TaxID=1196031 RepID=A0A161J5B5_9BACI|nr:phage minor capsid protein [Cytobacillus oceanisediminis]AND39611.1 minor capsid protein [Cytobacillus oceanisediminis 2691]